MATSVDWAGTRVISVPRADMTLIQSSPTEIRELDTNAWRLELRDLEEDPDGRPWPKTHDHNTEVLLGGINFARTLEILDPYTITFEDGQYAVNLTGSNNNILEKTNKNQVSVNPSNSAGLISSPAIEYSSFDGGVTVDLINGVAGTAYNKGTPGNPSNNFADVHLIAIVRGLNRIFIIGDAVLTIDASWDGHEFIGESALKTTITIPAVVSVVNCEFYEATVTGTLDGNAQLKNCIVNNLVYVDGYIENCALGNMTLGTTTIANIFDCKSTIPGIATPVIDMGNTGQLAMRNYTGGIKLINYNGTASHSIDLNSGQVILDSSTITNGTFVVRGVGKLVDENGAEIPTGIWNTNVTIVNELMNTPNITRHIERKVFVDTELLINGDGSGGYPYNNIGDAIDYAEANNAKEIIVYSEVTLDRNLKNFIITGVGAPVINCNGQDLKNTEFSHCTMRGDYIDRIVVQESVLDTGFHLNGFFERCAINGDLICNDGSNVLLANCFSIMAGLARPTISMNGAGFSTVSIRGYSGGLTIKDCNNVADAITVEMAQGKLTVDATCTAGIISVRGVAQFTDDSAGSTIDATALVENLIWDKILPQP